MSGDLYLIGGGQIAQGETKGIDDLYVSQAPKGSTLLFFGTAAGDSEGYAQVIAEAFEERLSVEFATRGKGREFAVDAINRAAIVYLGGGTTQKLLDLFLEWDLIDVLRAAWERGLCIVGLSAGAQALASWYAHDEDGVFEIRKGWGFVSGCVLVHANDDSVSGANDIWTLHKEASRYPLLALGDCTAWYVNAQGEGRNVGSGLFYQVRLH